ncbi:MAG: hypothetical protein JJE09_16195 [Bacteroidia bacterium]|nr:hypothetical protein [Bacteroidia bacterium]
MKSKFPYCQLIHNLAARAARDNQLENSGRELQLSAIYSTDRSVLKSIMASERGERIEVIDVAKVVAESKPVVIEPKSPQEIIPLPIPSGNDLSGDDLRAEITRDLNRLKKLKHEFEVSLKKVESRAVLTAQKEPKIISGQTVEPNSESLIKEIKSTKKKIKPEGAKQKEQFEIIDQFIKTQPTISSAKTKAPLPPATTDLTESNSAFGDNIISETLVDILLKQGKKDKAMEVLKKLIWKFPQKKAYFAAQIEELKK